MANGLDFYGLDDNLDSVVEPTEKIPLQEGIIEPDNNNNPQYQEDDLIGRILLSKGISDFNKIKFENDNGEIEEKT